MSSRSLNQIWIKIPTEIFDFILAAYNLVLFHRELFLYICTPRDDIHKIQQRCFIYRSIFTIPVLRRRRVQGHCEAYHFRMHNYKLTLHIHEINTKIVQFYLIFLKFLIRTTMFCFDKLQFLLEVGDMIELSRQYYPSTNIR